MSNSSNSDLFAKPRVGLNAEDCNFYHVMDLPGYGITAGQWDLRDTIDSYLGGVDFAGKRVLEIGPASGFLTFEMERRGAEVVCFEVSDEIGWDFAPYPAATLEAKGVNVQHFRNHLTQIKNSWWFSRQAYGGAARICYGNVYDMPEELGIFDIAITAAVLTHTRSPVRILEQCAKRCKTIIIAEPYEASLEGSPVCRLNPTVDNVDYGTWWHCSTDFYRQFLGVLGFEASQPVRYESSYHGMRVPLYTIVGTRT